MQGMEERLSSIDPDENELYRFLEIEQADEIKTKKVFVTKRVRMLTKTEVNVVNLVRAINAKVIPVAACVINFCKCKNGELKELDQVFKRGK